MRIVGPADAWSATLDDYLRWLRVMGRCDATIQSRRAHLSVFTRWVRSVLPGGPAAMTLEHLDTYRGVVAAARTRVGRLLAASTRLCRLAAVRQLVRWAVRTGVLTNDPARDFVLPRLPRRLPRAVLSAPEVQGVLASVDVTSPMGLRDRTILEVMFSTGMRRGEIVRLALTDVDAERGLVFVREGKGAKDRMVPIGVTALEWFARYCAEARPRLVGRRRRGGDPGAAFLGARGDPIRPNRLTDRMHKYVANASGKPGSCHIFRHSMATAMHDGGADIRDLQELLGHAQLSTTEIYTHVSVERLRSVHALTHPSEAGRAWLGHRLGGGIAPLLSLPPGSGRFSGPWGRGSGGR